MSKQIKYIIIDDDLLNNTICSMLLRRTIREVAIKTFALPWEGLVFIKNNMNNLMPHSVLFLDINMPELTGWGFLEHYEHFGEEIKKRISIYMLSSSINPRDMDKAKKHNCVKGFISKPLTIETILSIAENEFKN